MTPLTQVREVVATYGVQALTDAQLLTYIKSKADNLDDFFMSDEGKAIISLVDRWKALSSSRRSTKITSSSVVAGYFPELQSLEHEEFWILCLTRQNTVIKKIQIGRGSAVGAVVCIQGIVRSALKYNAQAVVMVHNHPSGALYPSEADIKITQRVKTALSVMEISLLDHVIVSTQGHYSFGDNGKI